MSDNIFYDIIYSIVGAGLYSAIIYTGYRSSHKKHKRAAMYLLNLKEVIEDIKHIIIKEEKEVDKEQFMGKQEVTEEVKAEFFGHATIINSLTLSDLLNNQPTDVDYEEMIDLLTKLAQDTYMQYKFLIFKSPDETKDTNLIQIVSAAADNPDLHKRIFAKAMNTNIDYNELVKRFAAKIALGEVIEIGDDVAVITNDGSAVSPTGVSQINNGMENGDIAFIISFIKKENLDAFIKNHFPQAAPAPVAEAPQEAPEAPVTDAPAVNE